MNTHPPSTKEISMALQVSERAVQIRARKENWPLVTMTGRGGKLSRYVPGLLPGDVRHALTVRHTEETGLVVPSPMPLPVTIPEQAKEDGLAKYQLVHAFRQARDAAPWGKKKTAIEGFTLAYNSGRFLPLVYEKVGAVTLKTIQGWDKKLVNANDDYLVLADGRGGWKKYGTTKWRGRKLSDAAKTAFLQCYLQQSQPSIITAVRAARYMLQHQGIEETAEASTYRRWLADYEKDNAHVVCLAREGMKAYQDKYGTYLTRDPSLLKPGQCLVADGKTLNFHILHPVTGKPVRMILIVFFDWASRTPVGWQIMPTENTIAIMAAFRNACIHLGRYPDVVYLDNGKAFKAKLFTETDPEIEKLAGLYARVGTATCFAAPYNGRAKVVERFFHTVQDQLECLLPSFIGDSIENKPAWMARNETFHRAWHEARTHGWVPDIRHAAMIIDAYFRWYSENPHSGLGGQRPIDVITPHLGPGIPEHQLIDDFLWTRAVQPRNCRIRLYNIDYEADCLHGKSRDRKIIVRYDTADLRQVYCQTTDGTYLGEAYPVRALNPLAKHFGDAVALADVKDKIKRQKRLARDTKEQLLALGSTRDDVRGLHALPYNRMETITPPQPSIAAPSDAPLDQKEVKRLELIVKEAAEATDDPVTVPKPSFWESDLHHYEWAFSVKYEHGLSLSEADQAFMDYFEKTEDFRENYQGRFRDLKCLYGINQKTA